MASKLICFLVIFSLTSLFMGASNAWLMQPDFYASSCPNVEQIVYNTMKQAVSKEPRMGASILRLFFHDCFVNMITPTFTGEKTAKANANNSIRGFEVIDAIKCNLEAACPQTVSCADILALASRDGVRLLGGPTWKVPLGRRDARTASLSLANQNLPPPRSSLANLTSLFARQKLKHQRNDRPLRRPHHRPRSLHQLPTPHLQRTPDIDPTFAATRQANCPKQAGNGDFNLAPLDRQTPNKFDNDYFQKTLFKNAVYYIRIKRLYNGGSQDSLVKKYSTNQAVFFQDLLQAMIKMGNIKLLTGTKGEIRKNCRVIN
uniref:Peroxidase n=1 Tax=Chenopodium quinoa TaxID=63459 RepID=A0A803N7H3_CHEQI